MKFSKKYFFITIILFVLLTGVYTGLKDQSKSSPNVSISKEAPMDSNISDLMTSMNIYKLTERRSATDFNLMSLEGDWVQLRKYRGRVVLLSFWATW